MAAADQRLELKPKAFTFLPLTDTKPRGWLKEQLRIQAETLGGHLEYFFVNNSLWMKDYPNMSAVPYPQKDLETVPYWLNGLLPLSYQLDDAHLLNVSRTYIDAILDRQQPDGWVGPDLPNSKCTIGCRSPWPRYRLLTVLASYAELFPEEAERTVGAMHRIVHSLASELRNITASGQQLKFADPWTHARWFELSSNVQVLLDADPADRYGDRAALFDAMETARVGGLDWATWYTQRECVAPTAAAVARCAAFPNASLCNRDPQCQFIDNLSCEAVDTDCFPCRDTQSKECPQAAEEYFCNHGVNTAQSLKFWAIEGRVAGALNASKFRDPGALANRTVQRMHRCHGQPGGVFSGHEQIGGIEPNRGTETCDVVEVMNSYAELFAAFGGVEYLDRIEAAGFNRLPAPYLNGSMWSMQYFHKTNAIGGCNAYGLPFECCVANGNQGWPRFLQHSYALPARNRDGSQDLSALLYAPNSIDTVLPARPPSAGRPERPSAIVMSEQRRAGRGGSAAGTGNRVRVTLDTLYPFGETLNFTVTADAPFGFRLRIPRWAADRATVAIGAAASAPATPGSDGFHVVGLPAGQSSLTLTLPSEVRVEAEQAGGVSVHWGALLFALDLSPQEHTTGPGGCYYPPHGCEIAALQPSVDWRQGLVLDRAAGPSGGLVVERVEHSGGPLGAAPPFNRASVGLRIRAQAAPIPNAS